MSYQQNSSSQSQHSPPTPTYQSNHPTNSYELPPIYNLQNLNMSSLQLNTQSEQLILTLFQIVQQQTYALQNIMGKVEQMKKKTNQLSGQVKSIIHKTSNPTIKIQDQSIKKDNNKVLQNIDSQSLIRILFADQNYQYKLELTEKIQMPLYRERNFSISLQLKNNQGQKIYNQNKIPLSLAIYSCQNPPKFLEANTAGQKMVKGYTEQTLQHGLCRFGKIQIREVTSHFRNGWVFIVVIPSMTSLGGTSTGLAIDYRLIQPLVLDKIVVKAKKIKQHNKSSKNGDSVDELHEGTQYKINQSSQNKSNKCFEENSEQMDQN